jgi:hypothetical protein
MARNPDPAWRGLRPPEGQKGGIRFVRSGDSLVERGCYRPIALLGRVLVDERGSR